MDEFKFHIDKDDEGERIDIFIFDQFDDFSRNFIQNLIKNDNVFVNEKLVKKNYRVQENDVVIINIPDSEILDVKPEDIPLNIVYEDDDLIVINKEQGMVVHPAPGNYNGTLVNALMFYSDRLSSINGIIRPGIVHRIDKDTSGLLVVAKNDFSHNYLSNLLRTHDIKRTYIAIVHGYVNGEGTVNEPLARHPKDRFKMAVVAGGREAITHYKPIKYYGNAYTLLGITLETGRTHQIRVHLSYIGHPILGDTIYGAKKEKIKHKGQLLHAKNLKFKHPRDNKMMEFEAELPESYKNILGKLEKMYGGTDGI